MTTTCVDYEDVQKYTFRKADCRKLNSLTPLEQIQERNTNEGQRVRSTLMEYFNNAGKVTFQDKMVDIVRL